VPRTGETDAQVFGMPSWQFVSISPKDHPEGAWAHLPMALRWMPRVSSSHRKAKASGLLQGM
jgi:hypothetical protein